MKAAQIILVAAVLFITHVAAQTEPPEVINYLLLTKINILIVIFKFAI